MDPTLPTIDSVPDDTHPAIQALLIEGYRKMSPAQKLERVRALNHTVQQLALMDIRRRHPNADEREQALRLASRWIEPDLMLRAFGWDVRKMGYSCFPSHFRSSHASRVFSTISPIVVSKRGNGPSGSRGAKGAPRCGREVGTMPRTPSLISVSSRHDPIV
jgi:hypothetical protein